MKDASDIPAAAGQYNIEVIAQQHTLGLNIEDAAADGGMGALGEVQAQINLCQTTQRQVIGNKAIRLGRRVDIAPVAAIDRVVVGVEDLVAIVRVLIDRGGWYKKASIGRPNITGAVGIVRGTCHIQAEQGLTAHRRRGWVARRDGEAVEAHRKRVHRILMAGEHTSPRRDSEELAAL